MEDYYRELARHYLLSKDAGKAIRYSRLAAEQARDRAAYTEADRLVNAGLHLLDKLPEGEERLRAELALRDTEGVLAFVLRGASSTERERAIHRFCEIAETLREQAQLLRGLARLSSVHLVQGGATLGLEVAKRCLDLRELTLDPELRANIYSMAAALSESCGKLREAVAYYESAAQAAREAAHMGLFGMERLDFKDGTLVVLSTPGRGDLLVLNPGGEWGYPGGCAKEEPRGEGLAGIQGGISHFGYMLPNKEEYERVIASAGEFGGKVVVRCDHGTNGLGGHTYLADPDGYVCEIQFGG